jgi:fructose-1,6-bisphosphatase/inositol monophosphatase family enzyme
VVKDLFVQGGPQLQIVLCRAIDRWFPLFSLNHILPIEAWKVVAFGGKMAIVDPEIVTAIIRQVAQEIILPRFRALGQGDVREKNPGDPVTIVDIEAERQLIRHLIPLVAGAVAVGEEGASDQPALLQRLQGEAPVWVIDPIDGTANFIKGDPHFGVIVALVQHQRTLLGWIHDPLSGRTCIAEQDGGSWSGGQRLKLAVKAETAVTGAVSWRDRTKLTRAGLHFNQLGSAAHEYLALLDGGLDFSCYRRLHPWDHAAGVLLYREAGGVAGLLEGGDYRPLPGPGTLLMAADMKNWQALQQLLRAQDGSAK